MDTLNSRFMKRTLVSQGGELHNQNTPAPFGDGNNSLTRRVTNGSCSRTSTSETPRPTNGVKSYSALRLKRQQETLLSGTMQNKCNVSVVDSNGKSGILLFINPLLLLFFFFFKKKRKEDEEEGRHKSSTIHHLVTLNHFALIPFFN